MSKRPSEAQLKRLAAQVSKMKKVLAAREVVQQAAASSQGEEEQEAVTAE